MTLTFILQTVLLNIFSKFVHLIMCLNYFKTEVYIISIFQKTKCFT